MATFIGDYPCRVDVKGRIVLPSAFKRQAAIAADDRFVVRKDVFENCLVLFTSGDWDIQLEKIRRHINPYNREHNMFLRNFFKGTAEVVPDGNNRLLIPRRLLDSVAIERDTILAGQDGRIEIWSEKLYGRTAMQPDDFADLAEKLLGGSPEQNENL